MTLRQVVAALFLVVNPATFTLAAPIIREPGAIYLSDFEEKPLRMKLLRPAPCFFDAGLGRYAGTLRFPQTVQVEAFKGEVCRIRGDARQGGVAAWIPLSELEPLPENFLSDLSKAEERRQTVEALIAQKEVALGMTPDEVHRSIGRPQKKSKRAEKDSLQETWEYIRYDLVPQTVYGPSTTQTVVTIPPGSTKFPLGTLVRTRSGVTANTVYVKVPVGTLTIVFQDGVVESMEQTEGEPTSGEVSVVVPPLEVIW